MGRFTTKRQEFRPTSVAAKRAAMLPSPDLVPWAETCLYEIGRSLLDYSRDPDPIALAEAANATAVLQAIIDEIRGRAGEPVGGSSERQ